MIFTIILILIDRFSKIWIMSGNNSITLIPGILNLSYVQNRGMVFGIAQGSVYFVAVFSLVVCIAIFCYIMKLKQKKDKFSYGWYLILAGGIGNIIDRFSYGFVVDFIDTPWIATFNLADAFITIGIILLIINTLFGEKNNKIGV